MPDVTGRTVDGIEEAMVPIDFSEDNPKLLMDYDLGAIFDTLPAGVNLTCFIDCCHSQTILRMFNRSAGVAPETGDERARFITLSAGEIAAVEQYQSKFGAIARGNVLGGQDRMREVAFAACRPDEVALESGGHGAFTRLAAPLLANAIGSMTHAQFQEAVANAFGPSPQQHPNLDCAPSAKTRLLLQPLA